MSSFQGRNVPRSFALWKVLVCIKLGAVGNGDPLPLVSIQDLRFSEKEEVMKKGIGRDFEGWIGFGSMEQEKGQAVQEKQLKCGQLK